MQKFLIIQTAYIGDVILATSLVNKIHQLAPEAQIDFLLRAGNESLLQHSDKITNVYIWNKKKKYSSLLSLIKKIRANKYDTVFNIQRFFNSGLLTVFSGAKTTIGFDKNPLSFLFTHKIDHHIPHRTQDDKTLHEVQRNARLLKPVFSDIKIDKLNELALELSFPDKDISHINAIVANKAPYLVIAPSSVWFTKQYPIQKWMDFLEALPDNLHIFCIGAPTDFDFIQKLIPSHKKAENMAGKLSLLQSALLMKDALRVFVNDSAPLHLASAVQAKTTAIFCSTSTDFGYFPLSENSVVIEEKLALTCRPCGLHGKKACPLGHFECAYSIETKNLIETIDLPKS